MRVILILQRLSHSLAHGSFLPFSKPATGRLSPCPFSSLLPTLLPSSSIFKDLFLDRAQIIQDNLPISRCGTQSHSSPFCHTKKNIQVPGIRKWTSLGAIILPTTPSKFVNMVNYFKKFAILNPNFHS